MCISIITEIFQYKCKLYINIIIIINRTEPVLGVTLIKNK